MPLQLGEFSAWITVDDVELPIYDATTQGTHVSCWIPSEIDKKFVVKTQFTPRTTAIASDVYVDGKPAAGCLSMITDEPVERTIRGVDTSTTTLKPFTFSKLELTDDDQFLNSAQQDLGEIRVEIISVIVTDVSSSYSQGVSAPESIKIHERSKKAIGHHVKLGEEISCERRSFYYVQRLNKLATFSFRYRPLDILQANGIAPLPPKPHNKRQASSDVVLDLTEIDDEDDDTEKQIEALQEQLNALRKRRKTTHVKSELGVKQESGIKKDGGGSRIVHLGTVDLT